MKTLSLNSAVQLMLVGFVLAFAAGCGIFRGPIEAGSEEGVVRAEQAVQASFESVMAFLRVEKQNEALVKDTLPEVHGFAQGVRRKGYEPFDQAWDAIGAYKATRSPDDNATMQAKLDIVSSLSAKARKYLAQVQAARR